LAVAIIAWSARIVSVPKIEPLPDASSFVMVGGAVKAITPPVIPKTETRAVLVNAELIDCLVEHESSGDPTAKGDAGEKGILQFMPGTFEKFCVEKYGLGNDIWNVEIQKECADKMIIDGGIEHWTTRFYCKTALAENSAAVLK